jgi:2-polyprenyl-3-methyl-5-hydroxy-6-metoxy-1,4-benzoquinol methylase
MTRARRRQPGAEGEAAPRCWCGRGDLVPFSPDYLRCASCETLRLVRMPAAPEKVTKDEKGLYGKSYWFEYQERQHGYPDITSRARADLAERCVHWLRTVLKYKVPPGRALELGSSHGGFVAMLRWAGFDARGLELSPWVVDYARRTFDVEVLLGPLEAQDVPPASLDVIALMDVLEHLPDPETTMRRALELLKPDGILVIQTPHYREGAAYDAMVAADDPFLEQLKVDEHLYLFSRRSVEDLLRRAGAAHVAFEPAIFSQYDMCVVAGREPLEARGAKDVDRALEASSSGRLVRAILDLDDQRTVLKASQARIPGLEAEREHLERQLAERQEVIDRQAATLGLIPGFEADHGHLEEQLAERQEVIARQAEQLARIPGLEAEHEHLRQQLAERLQVIERQAEQLGRIPGLQAEHEHLRQELAERLAVIERQADQIARIPGLQAEHEHLRQELAERLAVIERQADQLARIPGLEADVAHLHARLAENEALRSAREAVVEQQATQIARIPGLEANLAEVQGRLTQGEVDLAQVRARLAESEADRAAQRASLEDFGRRMAAVAAALAAAGPVTRLRVAWPAEVRRLRRLLEDARSILGGADPDADSRKDRSR